ncbi:MAG: hypothetical protein KGP29_05820, partial [Proteobacteria bacterium]|nr:hypothetical protein [Pseudomonadota bacterium]
MKITQNNYKKLLTQIHKTISRTEQEILQRVSREKVEMCWEIGKILDEHLSKNNRDQRGEIYGKKLFHDLSRDLSIVERTLYQMRSFYKAYPTLPKNNLNWSHYRNLVSVKDSEQRKLLEDLALTEQLGVKDLQREIVKSKPREQPKKLTTKLKFTRGKLLTYSLTKDGEVDLGFNIFVLRASCVVLGGESVKIPEARST